MILHCKVRTVSSGAHRSRRRENGYALLILLFFAAVMVIAAGAAVPNLLTQGKRAREDEMIWRGGQYERAVRLYYHKNGKFPQKIEDLVKGNGQMRFLRKEYKDPMNTADGSWRLIYVTPAGILIGSLRYKSLAQMNAALHPGQPTPFGGMLPPGQGQGQPQSQSGATPPGGAGAQTPEEGQGGGAPPQGPGQTGGAGGGQGTPEETDTGLSGPVIGGNLIGVGGTVNKRSLKVYEGGKTYRRWEFIWNPLAEATIQGATGPTPGQPIGTPQGPSNPNPPPPPPQPPQQ
jgi:type II secretory pathway pseudopilin PulG